MPANVPNPGTYLAQLATEFTGLRDILVALNNRNAYITAQGGAPFLETAYPNGLGMDTTSAPQLIAALGNITHLYQVANGNATQATTLDFIGNTEPFWGG